MNYIDEKYLYIISENRRLSKQLVNNEINIVILSNIIVHQIKEILEYPLRTEGINAKVEFGDYDNIVQDSQKYIGSSLVIIFWELCNIIDGLQYKIELLSENGFETIIEKLKLEIDLVLKNLQKTSLVLINKFTSLHFLNSNIRERNLHILGDQLNKHLKKAINANVRLVDLEKVLSIVGVEKSIDFRTFYSSKALYTVDFFKAYAEYIKPFIMSVNGKAKKILIFDCDNTLWNGILGEDGFDKIEMSSRTKAGAVFYEIQALAVDLQKQGILIGLNSKNNPDDVDEVIRFHPDMQLKDEYITINKSNWSDKVSNLREIADELNIGLDSFVVIDDSPFEVNLIKKELPEVTVLQVPVELYKYPKMFRENMGLFYNHSITAEDRKKIGMYKQQEKREGVKKKFTDIEDYLESLELKMTIHENNNSIIHRISQLTQKTNQFNLTTKRYTEGDIKNFIENKNFVIVAFSISDKFGDSGVTGLCIVNLYNKIQSAEIDSFLMSCRIIGRNIEYAFVDYLMNILNRYKINTITANYIRTKKNEQVKEFYDRCSFSLTKSTNSVRNYTLDRSNYKPKRFNYIEVINESQY